MGGRWSVAAVVALTALAITVGKDGTHSTGPALLLLSFAAFALLIRSEMRRPTLSRRQVWGATGAVLLVAVIVPPQSSRDLWSYAVYGRAVSVYHESPYTHVPREHPRDVAVRHSNPVWGGTASVYGPVFTAVSAAGTAVAGNSPLRIRLFFQLLAAACVCAILVLLERWGAPPGALAFVGLNPLIAASIVNNGHNDLLVGVAVLAAVVMARERRGAAVGALMALGCLVKVAALVPFGAVVVWLWFRDRVAAVWAAVAGGAVFVVGYLAGGGRAALAPLGKASNLISENSWWDALSDVRRSAGEPSRPLIWVTVAVVLVVVSLGWQRRTDPVAVTGATVLAYILAAPYVLPWYVGWILPVLALTWRSRLTWVAMTYSTLALISYSKRPSMAPLVGTVLEHTRGALLPIVEVLALVGLIVVAWRRRQATELAPR